jgi:hypothetical protein
MLTVSVTPQLKPSLGLSFTHFSNGAFQKPNLGLNIPSVNVGLEYGFGKAEINQKPIPSAEKPGKRAYLLTLAGAKKERKPAENKNYPVFALFFTSHKSNNLKSYWGYGADLFYDDSKKRDLQKEEASLPSFIETAQAGIHLSYLLKAGKVYYVVQPGVYVHSRYKEDGLMYHRLGTRYQLTENLLLNTTLKTHWAVADHFEIGLTCKIR